jgi:NAD(P)-dependent dehydrogenase (short-subunit alcohol dehydrogenase family)
VLEGRRAASLQAIALEIVGGGIPTDVASVRELASLFEICAQTYGRLAILVNNAGIVGPTIEMEREDVRAWDEVLAVNVRRVMLCVKHAVPLMKHRGCAISNIAADPVLRPKA